jgi:hypothetical protein
MEWSERNSACRNSNLETIHRMDIQASYFWYLDYCSTHFSSLTLPKLQSGRDFDAVRLKWVTIAAHGLRIPTKGTEITSAYRFRDATRLDELPVKERPRAFNQIPRENVSKAQHTAQEAELAINKYATDSFLQSTHVFI